MTVSDRPFRRKVCKIAALLLYGSRRAHAQDWFPHLALTEAADGTGREVVYRGRRVARLAGAHVLKEAAGEAIVIVGSGPSVSLSDPRRIPPQTAILLNGALALLGIGIDRPLAVAVEDERFVYRHFDHFLKAVDRRVPVLLSVAAIRAICELDGDWLADRPVVLIDNITKPYGRSRLSPADLQSFAWVELSPDRTAGFSLEPDRGVFQGGSVAISALQFAVSCTPSEIGFLGIDLSNAQQPRFYETEGSTAYSGIVSGQERILAHFAVAADIARARGIDLVNFSPVSALGACGIAYSDRLALPR